jgi:hypothetical protein
MLGILTNKKLAEAIEARGRFVSMKMDCVFGQFNRMDIPFAECCAQLGAENPHVIAYRAALDALLEAEGEARKRLGPEPSYMLQTYLMKSPRYRPQAAKA